MRYPYREFFFRPILLRQGMPLAVSMKLPKVLQPLADLRHQGSSRGEHAGGHRRAANAPRRGLVGVLSFHSLTATTSLLQRLRSRRRTIEGQVEAYEGPKATEKLVKPNLHLSRSLIYV